MREWWKPYLVAGWLPEQTNGRWRIERFEVPKRGTIIAELSYGVRMPPPGMYTRLLAENAFGPMMSDTPAEIHDHFDMFSEASGRVFMAGLGLGMASAALLRKRNVESIHVIEKDMAIIEMVKPHLVEMFGESSVTVEHGDVLQRKPQKGETYDYCWFDIWPDICSDNLKQMGMLHRRWTRRCNGRYSSWSFEICQYNKRRDTGF